MEKLISITFAFLLILNINGFTKGKEKDKDKIKAKDTTEILTSQKLNALSFRLIGPGLTSGRIVDFAVNPKNFSEYFVAVACGGVWKTTNGGITYNSVFDSQESFSIGCLAIDPNNPFVVWVGTGENNSQRSVSWGDGIYKSVDGGKTWKNMGLKKSEHIGKILIDPRNSNVVYVAAQGPLWGSGGERGLYKTTDGGNNWELILKISENTGISDIAFDPRNPDVIYASSYQRRRHVWTLINGGPEAAIYKTVDGGKTWNKLTNGLPSGDVGRIGLAVSPINPDVVYALIELPEGKGGFYRSTDRGESWSKRSEYATVSAQYYQEIVADPVQFDRIYSLDTYLKYSDDGGKTWQNLGNKHRHVDDHAIWINPQNNSHIIVGGDGGIYETYDRGENWRHSSHLPVTQFYRVGIDNSEPFYFVYGGTQDNNSWGCPSRTTNSGGITNEDWFLIVGGDGYQVRVDPKNPNILYGMWQYGNLVRYDKKSGEVFYIQPQPEKGEELRWNWDTPLIISPHSNTRIYIAANKLFRSDDLGNSWKAVSGDLTRQIDRDQLKVMDKIWPPEAVAKNASTSFYGNIVALSESPIKENLIYVGTDDGLIQITENGGENWTRIEKIIGVPETTYVSDIFASIHDENVVYASFDNHKNADFRPYLLKSNDKGRTWISIAGNLPENAPVYCVYEDHINKNLLFAGTEYGIFFTIDGGQKWIQLKGGIPTIAVRDIEIQTRENDLILATFGRGIYILDDYSPLRDITPELLKKDIHIFPVKDAWLYNEDDSKAKNDLGETFYRAKNPPFGATITFYLKEALKSKKDIRKETEKKLIDEGKTPPYPSFTDLRAEDEEEAPYLFLKITDIDENVVRILKINAIEGFNRVTWDCRFPDASPVTENTKTDKFSGMPVMPGKYKAFIYKNNNGEITKLAGPIELNLKVLNNVTLPAKDRKELVDFQRKTASLQRAVMGTNNSLEETKNKINLMKIALLNTTNLNLELLEKARKIEKELYDIEVLLNGDDTKAKRNANQTPSITDRLNYILWGIWAVSSAPTKTQIDAFNIASEQLKTTIEKLRKIIDTEIIYLEQEMEKNGSPWTPGRLPDWR